MNACSCVPNIQDIVRTIVGDLRVVFLVRPSKTKISRALSISLLTLVGLLAGCTGKADVPSTPHDEADADAPAFLTMPMDVHDCSFIMAVVPVESAKVAAYLPAGFTPIAPTELGIPAPEEYGQSKDGMLGLEAESCDRVREGEDYKPGPTGSYWIPVHPPEDQRVAGVEFNVVKLDVLGWNAEGVDMLKQAGLLAATGTTSFMEPFPTDALPATPADSELWGMNWYSASLKFDGGETIDFQGGGSITKYFVASPFQVFTCHGYFPINGDPANGIIEGQTDFEASVIHESMGVLNVIGSGTASKIIGAGEHNYYALVGYGSYWNQEMWLPAPQAAAEPAPAAH